jgi:hypothetical protein
MKKTMVKRRGDDLRREYDLTRLNGGVRGKYHERATKGTNLVLLDPDVALAFPDSITVNRALRLLRDLAVRTSARRPRRATTRAR